MLFRSYETSYILQALIDTDTQEARKLLFDKENFLKFTFEKYGGDHRRNFWITKLLADNIRHDEKLELYNIISSIDMDENSYLYAVNILLYYGDKNTVDKVIELSKKLREPLKTKMLSQVAGYIGFAIKVDNDMDEIIKYRTPNEVIRIWETYRDELTWNDISCKYESEEVKEKERKLEIERKLNEKINNVLPPKSTTETNELPDLDKF
mgnify:FL=1